MRPCTICEAFWSNRRKEEQYDGVGAATDAVWGEDGYLIGGAAEAELHFICDDDGGSD